MTLYGSAIVESSCNGRTKTAPGPMSGSIFSGRSRSPIAHGCWDCTRIAIGLWIAACVCCGCIVMSKLSRDYMVLENLPCLSAWPWPNHGCCTVIVGLPWNLRNPISSSIILPLFLPLELCWDSMIALGLRWDSGLC